MSHQADPRRCKYVPERPKGHVCPRRPERPGHAVPHGETDVADQGPQREEELEKEQLKGRVCPHRPECPGHAVPQGERGVADQDPQREEELEEEQLKGRGWPRRPERLGHVVPQRETDVTDRGPQRKEELKEHARVALVDGIRNGNESAQEARGRKAGSELSSLTDVLYVYTFTPDIKTR